MVALGGGAVSSERGTPERIEGRVRTRTSPWLPSMWICSKTLMMGPLLPVFNSFLSFQHTTNTRTAGRQSTWPRARQSVQSPSSTGALLSRDATTPPGGPPYRSTSLLKPGVQQPSDPPKKSVRQEESGFLLNLQVDGVVQLFVAHISHLAPPPNPLPSRASLHCHREPSPHCRPTSIALEGNRARSRRRDRSWPLGPSGCSSSQHRRTPELVLQKSHASFREPRTPEPQDDQRPGANFALCGARHKEAREVRGGAASWQEMVRIRLRAA